MTKAQLQELARFGVRQKLELYELELAAIFQEFPEEFITPTPPVLRRPLPKRGGNDWPAAVVAGNGHLAPPPNESRIDAIRAILRDGRALSTREIVAGLRERGHQPVSTTTMTKFFKVTPGIVPIGATARRKYILQSEPYKPRVAKPTKKATTKRHATGREEPPWGHFLWQRIHDFLLTQENRTGRLKDICERVNTTGETKDVSAACVTAMLRGGHAKRFKRVGPGHYRLVSPVKTATPTTNEATM